VRAGDTQINPGPNYKFFPEDIVVLLGSPEQIEKAVECISVPRE
jgi:K+/H+ antiporter YhaU regulatory subunit KhtT